MWMQSQFINVFREISHEEEKVEEMIPEYFQPHYQDLIHMNVTKENYKYLIELCDFLHVTNVDIIIDKIVDVFDDINIIYTFEKFYKTYSQRLIPMDNETLKNAITLWIINDKECYRQYGFSSFWDVSKIKKMDYLFKNSNFNGDISRWDVSNVIDMFEMFFNSKFNGDISRWDVSNVVHMSGMFNLSLFTGDISNWNVSKVKYMSGMFKGSLFNSDISRWDVSNAIFMSVMFKESLFNGDISRWDISKVRFMWGMFLYSQFEGDVSKWNPKNLWEGRHMFSNPKFANDIKKWDVLCKDMIVKSPQTLTNS